MTTSPLPTFGNGHCELIRMTNLIPIRMANLKSLEWPFRADRNDHSEGIRMTILTTTRFFKEEKPLRMPNVPIALK